MIVISMNDFPVEVCAEHTTRAQALERCLVLKDEHRAQHGQMYVYNSGPFFHINTVPLWTPK